MKANCKRLKADLALGVRKLGPISLALKLGEFLLFGSFFNFSPLDFLDLDNFRDLANFWPFDFPDFLAIFIPPILLSPLPLSTFSKVNLSGGTAVFSIEVNEVAILLNPWMNYR